MKKGREIQLNSIEICTACKNDVDSIFSISTLSFPVSWSKNSIEKEVTMSENAFYLTAKMNDIIIGYGGIWKILDEAHLMNIAVHPEYRGIGAGEKILEALIDLCRIKNINDITLEVRVSNIPAQNLYKKFGFMQEGIRKHYYSNNNEDALIMWKHNIL